MSFTGNAAHVSGLMDMKIATDKNASWYNRMYDVVLNFLSLSLLLTATKRVSLVKGLWILAPFGYRNRLSVCWPRVEPFFKSLRESTDLPIGAIGYCWGGRCKFAAFLNAYFSTLPYHYFKLSKLLA